MSLIWCWWDRSWQHLSNYPLTEGTKFRHTPTQRKLSSMAFFHGGHQVCGKTFRKLHGIGMHTHILDAIPRPTQLVPIHCSLIVGKDRFTAVKASFIVNGLTTRQHGNSKRLPHNALTFDRWKSNSFSSTSTPPPQGMPVRDEDEAAGRIDLNPTPPKKLQLCSKCKGSGHNRRTCPQLRWTCISFFVSIPPPPPPSLKHTTNACVGT